jgi:hypothetical protein
MLVNVVNSPSIAEQVGNNFFLQDLNADKQLDVIMRTDNQMFVKYALLSSPNIQRPGTYISTLYRAPTLSLDFLEQLDEGALTLR